MQLPLHIRPGAELIGGHLGPAILRSEAADAQARRPFENHIQHYEGQIEPMPLSDVAEIFTRAPRSSSGLDVVPYASWAHGGRRRRLLVASCVHKDVVRGDSVRPLLNQAWLVCIPRAPLALDMVQVAHLAGLRRLTLSNSCHKIVAKALCVLLEVIAR